MRKAKLEAEAAQEEAAAATERANAKETRLEDDSAAAAEARELAEAARDDLQVTFDKPTYVYHCKWAG